MTGQLFINDKDAWITWGVFLEDGSEAKLLLPPPMKEYTSNNFRSQDGKQVFIVNPKKDERDISLVFCISAITKEKYLLIYDDFVSELTSGLVKLRVQSIDKELNLTVSSFLDLSYYERVGKLSVRFNESFSVPVVFDALATEGTDLILTEDGKTILI